MAKFRKADILENGDIFLTPGVYFVDLQTAKFNRALPTISASVLPQSGDEMILSGRGQVMASFTVLKDTVIPRSLGVPFWVLPDGASLGQAADALYGNYFKEGYGLFDYLSEKHPELLQIAVETGETYVKTLKEVGKIGSSTTKTVVIVVAAVGILYIGMRLLPRK